MAIMSTHCPRISFARVTGRMQKGKRKAKNEYRSRDRFRRLRDFIRAKYEDKRWVPTGEQSSRNVSNKKSSPGDLFQSPVKREESLKKCNSRPESVRLNENELYFKLD